VTLAAALVGVGALVGAAGGLLVPLPAYRLSVPADEPDRGACTACAAPLPAGLPGWVRLPATCPACGVALGPPAWLTAAAGGLAGGLLAAALTAAPELPLFLALAVLGVLLAAVDLACRRLPHKLVMPALWLATVLFAGLALATGAWGAWIRAVLAAAVLGGLFLLLANLPGGGLGHGDVKLAALLGLFLGWLGWRAVLWGGLLPWLINGPVVLALLLAGRVRRRSALPFGPALLAGALLAVLVNAWLPDPAQT
jgi:leader peptidase (prepilin peptidase) / N-methyltransferase